MQLELLRVDYNLVGQIAKKCICIMPPNAHNQMQKIVAADTDGIIQVFGLMRGELEVSSRTGPGPPINSVCLGGMLGEVQDKIFVASGNNVRGFTKKGRQFLGFDTNITEPINTICVAGSDLIVCAANSIYHYNDCKEVNSVLCADSVVDATILIFQHVLRTVLVACCEDKTITVLDLSVQTTPHVVPLPSTPSVLYTVPGKDAVLYGTRNGGVGCLFFPNLGEVVSHWIVEPDQSGSEITCLYCYDLIGSGTMQLLLGRDDGTVQVRTLPELTTTGLLEEPSTVIYSQCFNESIRGVLAGCVSTPNLEEVIVGTFSGWIFGLTPETGERSVTMSTDAHQVHLSEVAHTKLLALKSEIDDLEERILREREKYQAMSMEGEDVMSAIPPIHVNDKLSLNAEDSSYWLTIEVQSSIDNVLIQSDVPIDLLDVFNNSAVVSFSQCDPNDGNFLLATYRCQLNTTRLQLKLRTIEGQHGTVRAYITPNIQPKCCQVREYPIRPLSLHTRAHSRDPARPYNILSLRGAFSLAEMHTWVSICLPEVPPKPVSDSPTMHFTSTLVNTALTVSYRKGEADFESDNISTISILKDVLTKEATRSSKKRNIDITWNINDHSIAHTLSLIHPKLTKHLELQRQSTILQAVTELGDGPDGRENLSQEYADILAKETLIQDQLQKQPAFLDRLCGILTDLYIDVYKFQGVQVKHKVPALLSLLTASSPEYFEKARQRTKSQRYLGNNRDFIDYTPLKYWN